MKIHDRALTMLKSIRNVQEYAYAHRYIVYQEDRDGGLWFYGAFSDGVHAGMVGYYINGRVLDMETGEIHRREDLR